MSLKRLDHYHVETNRPDETVAFYCDVLGCGPRTWLLVDDHSAIHVNFVQDDLAAPTGATNHVAFEASGYVEMCERLNRLGVDYETVESPQFDLLQIYVVDPNMIRVEIDIRGENEALPVARAGQSPEKRYPVDSSTWAGCSNPIRSHWRSIPTVCVTMTRRHAPIHVFVGAGEALRFTLHLRLPRGPHLNDGGDDPLVSAENPGRRVPIPVVGEEDRVHPVQPVPEGPHAHRVVKGLVGRLDVDWDRHVRPPEGVVLVDAASR